MLFRSQGGETTTAFEKIENGKIIELVKNLKIQQNKKIYLPLGILNELNINLEKDENYVEYELINDNKIRITLKESIEQSNKEKELKAMGEIITVKVNKGGVGKTFVTLQLSIRIGALISGDVILKPNMASALAVLLILMILIVFFINEKFVQNNARHAFQSRSLRRQSSGACRSHCRPYPGPRRPDPGTAAPSA